MQQRCPGARRPRMAPLSTSRSTRTAAAAAAVLKSRHKRQADRLTLNGQICWIWIRPIRFSGMGSIHSIDDLTLRFDSRGACAGPSPSAAGAAAWFSTCPGRRSSLSGTAMTALQSDFEAVAVRHARTKVSWTAPLRRRASRASVAVRRQARRDALQLAKRGRRRDRGLVHKPIVDTALNRRSDARCSAERRLFSATRRPFEQTFSGIGCRRRASSQDGAGSSCRSARAPTFSP